MPARIRRIGVTRNLEQTRKKLAEVGNFGQPFSRELKDTNGQPVYVCDWNILETDWVNIEKALRGFVKWYDEGSVAQKDRLKRVKQKENISINRETEHHV